MAQQPFSFADLVDWQAAAGQQDPFFAGLTLPEFSQQVEQQFGSGTAQAGMSDGLVARASGAVDRFLRPFSRKTGAAGRSFVGSVFGEEHADLGERLGRELPRGAVETIAAFNPYTVVPAAISSGAKAYTESGGNFLAGLIGGATVGTMKPVAQLGHSKITVPLVEKLAESTLKGTGARNALRSFLQRGAESLGPNVTLAAQSELAAQGTSLAITGQPFNPFTEEHLVEQAAGQLPFAVFDAMHVLNYRKPSMTEAEYLAEKTARPIINEIKKDMETFHKTAATKTVEPPVPPDVKPPASTVAKPPPASDPAKNPLTDTAHVDIGGGVKMRADLLSPYNRWLRYADSPRNAKTPWDLQTIVREANVSQKDAEVIYDMGMKRGLISPEGTPLKLVAGEADLLDNLVFMRRKKDDGQMALPLAGEKGNAEPDFRFGQVATGELDEFGVPVMKPVTHLPLMSSLAPFRATFLPHMRIVREILSLMPESATRGAYLKAEPAEVKAVVKQEMPEGVPPVPDELGGLVKLDLSDPTKWDVQLFMDALKNLPQAVAPTAPEGRIGMTAIRAKNPEMQAIERLQKLITGERKMSDLLEALDDPLVQEALAPLLAARGIDAIQVPFNKTYRYMPPGELHQLSLGLMPERLQTDSLLQQLTAEWGKGAPSEVVGNGPIETMRQLYHVYGHMARLAGEALSGHPERPLETWMKGAEQFTQEMLGRGHAPEVVAERMYQKMMHEVRDKMIPVIESKQYKDLEDSLRQVQQLIEKVPPEKRARALREIYKTERDAVLAKMARLSELERPLPNGVVLLDELVQVVVQRPRQELSPDGQPVQVGIPETRDWIKELEGKFGAFVDPMARVYAAAVDFYDNWELYTRIYRRRPGREAQIARDGRSEVEVVKDAFSGYVRRAGWHAASEQAKDTLRVARGVAERAGLDPKELQLVPVETDEGERWQQHRLQIVSEAQLEADAESAALNASLQQFITKSIPGNFSRELWVEMRDKAGLAKTTGPNSHKLRRRFEILLSMARDGVFGYRFPKFTKGAAKGLSEDLEVFIREGAGIREADLTEQLGFTDKEGGTTRRFVRDEFLPTLKQLIRTAKENPDRLKYGLDEIANLETGGAAQASGATPKLGDDTVGPPVRTLDTMALQARVFFEKEFSGMGYDEAQTRVVVDLATKMAYSFQAVAFANITGIETAGIMGASVTRWVDDKFQSLVGIHFRAIEDTFGKKLGPFKALWTLGHELAHTVLNTAEAGGNIIGKEHVLAFRKWGTEMDPHVRGALIEDLFRLVLPQDVMRSGAVLELLETRRTNAVRDPEEFMADFISLHASAHISPYRKEMSAQLATTLDYNTAFFRGMFANLFDLTSSVKSFLYSDMASRFDSVFSRGTYKKATQAVFELEKMQGHIKHVLADIRQVEDSFEALQRVEAMEPARYAEMVASAVTPRLRELSTQSWYAPDDSGKWMANYETDSSVLSSLQTALGLKNHKAMEDAYGLVPRAHHKWFFPMAQLANRFPLLWPAARVVYNFRADVNSLLEGFLAPFMTTTVSGRLALDIKGSGLSKALQDPAINRAVTWIALRKNEIMDANPSSGGIMTDDQMIRALASRFPQMSDANKRVVVDMHRNLEKIMPQVAQEYVKSQKVSVKNHVAMAMQRLGKGHSPAALYKLADSIVDRVYLMKDPNQTPEGAARRLAGQEQLRTDLMGVDPELLGAGLEMANTMIDTVYDLEKHFGVNVGAIPGQFEGRLGAFPRTGHTPEVRKGRHLVTWGDDEGRTGAQAFDDVKLANMYAAEMRSQGRYVRQQDTQDKASLLDGMGPKVAQAFARREQEAFKAHVERIRAQHGDEIADLLANYDVGSLVLKDVASRSIGKYKLPRQLREGRDEINTMENVLDYLFASATALAKRNAKESMALHLSDPSMTGNPKLRKMARDHLLTVLDPPTKELTFFKNANFLMYMAGNFSTMMVELSQSLVTLAPSLTEQVLNGHKTGVLDSYKYIGKAVSAWVDALKPKPVGSGRTKGQFTDPDLQRAVDNARKRGILDFGIMQEFHPDMDSAFLNLRNLISGTNRKWAGYEYLTKPITWVMHTSRWLYSQFPKFNTHLAYIAAYKLAKDRGYSGQAAEGFAEQIVLTSNFGGGPAGRPVGLFANNGKLHGAVGAMYSLQTYMFGMTAMLSRMAEVSIGNVKGFSPAQRSAARRAFAQALATQLAAAGALGLPLAEGLVALVEQFFPVNLRKWLREQAVSAGSWVTQDDEMGQVFGDVAMRGVVNKMFEAANVPIDVGSRLSLGQGMGLDSYSGFGLKNVVGPIGGVFESVGRGVQKMAAGDWGEGAELMVPRAVQKALRLYNDQGVFRDQSGQLIYEPSTLEAIAYRLGFQPQVLREHQEAAQMTRQSEKVWAAQMQKFHHRLADMVEAGDFEGARLALIQMEQDHPDAYNARAGARNVAELVRTRNTPVDLLDEGTKMGARSRAEIMAMVSRRQVTPEVERLQMQKQIEAVLGVPRAARMSRTELSTAMAVDRMVEMNPLLSHQMARSIVERAMARRRGPSLLGGQQ